MADIRANLTDPDALAQRIFFRTAYPNHDYGIPPSGTLETVPKIDVPMLQRFLETTLTRTTLQVTAAGDITPEQLSAAIERVFGTLPQGEAQYQAVDLLPDNSGETFHVPLDTPQTVVLAGQRGVHRSDPRWFAAQIMNYALGGGGFASRLMQEIRVKRGLTYGVSSYLMTLDRAALMMVGGATANATAGEFLKHIQSEWLQMAKHGITDEELQAAKAYLSGSFALRLTSTESIADLLLQIRRDGLAIDYLERRDELIAAVTNEQVRKVAAEILDPEELGIVVVGAPLGLPRLQRLDPE